MGVLLPWRTKIFGQELCAFELNPFAVRPQGIRVTQQSMHHAPAFGPLSRLSQDGTLATAHETASDGKIGALAGDMSAFSYDFLYNPVVVQQYPGA